MLEHKRIERLMLFVELAKQLNFSRAAEKLGISKSYLSEQIKKLEQDLQTPLVIRTTRSVRLTPEGERAYHQGLGIKGAVLDLERNLFQQHNQVSGLIKITAPKMFAETKLLALCEEFKKLHPEIEFEINSSYQAFDLSQTDIDLAFRATKEPPQNMVAHELFEYYHWLVASPEYLEQRGAPKTPQALEQHDCLSTLHQKSWPLGDTEIHVSGWLGSNENRLLKLAALNGHGIVRIASYFVADEVEQGLLKRVLTSETDKMTNSLYLVYPQLIYPPAKLKTFIDFIKRHVK